MKCKKCDAELKGNNCPACDWIDKLFAKHDPAKGKFIDQFMTALTNACDKKTLGVIIKKL